MQMSGRRTLAIAATTFVLGASFGFAVAPTALGHLATAQGYLITKAAEVCAPHGVASVAPDRIECKSPQEASLADPSQPT